jgi:hypothetical protein
MTSRLLACLTAASLVCASTTSFAQTSSQAPAPTPETETPQPAPQQTGGFGETEGFFKSDLVFMLAAIAGAVLLTLLATQIGGDDAEDQPASP